MESCNEQMDRRLFNTSVKKCEQLAKSFKRCVLGPSMGRWQAGRPPAEGLGSEEEVRARRHFTAFPPLKRSFHFA